MDKGLTLPKWVLINWPKIPQMPQNVSAQLVCPSPKDWDFDEKRLHWASVVRATVHIVSRQFQNLCSRFRRKKNTIEFAPLNDKPQSRTCCMTKAVKCFYCTCT